MMLVLIPTYLYLTKVTRVTWWMAHWGSPTPKRQYMYSNCAAVSTLDRGKLHLTTWRKKNKNAPQTTKRYKDGKGRDCWSGTDQLRKTECLLSVGKTIHSVLFFIC